MVAGVIVWIISNVPSHWRTGRTICIVQREVLTGVTQAEA